MTNLCGCGRKGENISFWLDIFTTCDQVRHILTLSNRHQSMFPMPHHNQMSCVSMKWSSGVHLNIVPNLITKRLYLEQISGSSIVGQTAMSYSYTFTGYPPDCPPQPHSEKCDSYFRVVKNSNANDPNNFRSHFETGERQDAPECARRSLSMYLKKEDAVGLSKNWPTKGRYIARLDLKGGHGLVRGGKNSKNSHHDWWVADGVVATDFCKSIEGPIT